MHDPLGLSDKAVLVPQHMASLLALCDGTRDIGGLQAGLALRTGIQLTPSQVRDVLAEMDAALLLENGAFRQATADALTVYRQAEHRRPSHADLVYPSNPAELTVALEEYGAGLPPPGDKITTGRSLAGVVCPHVDYKRGGATYAHVWREAFPFLKDVELVVVFGTDHAGGPGSITLTRQSYATPFGVLPTDSAIVDGLADTLGPERAFAEELHHINEHSIELAMVWFHHYADGRPCPTVPVLCGSYQEFIQGEGDPSRDETINAMIAYLREATAGRRTLVVAAADLSHIGPAFGDPAPIDAVGKVDVRNRDARSIGAICDGDPETFYALSREESDNRHLCGLPPIYMALRLLGNVRGESLGYTQCPADIHGGSLVSIAGVLLYRL